MKQKWTKKIPLYSGWYWAIEESGDAYTMEIVQVIKNSHEHYVLSTEHDGRDEVNNYDWWMGPIKTPSVLPW